MLIFNVCFFFYLRRL